MTMTLLIDERIRLRALEPEDLDLLYKWENDTHLWERGSTLAPFSRYILREYIAHSGNDLYSYHQLRLMVERRDTTERMGLVDLFDFDPHASRAACGMLVDTPFQRQGYGSAALRLLMDYAFTFLRLHQLYAHVPATNEASLRTLTRCGFVECGMLKDWIRTPRGYADVRVMQLFEDQFKKGSLG